MWIKTLQWHVLSNKTIYSAELDGCPTSIVSNSWCVTCILNQFVCTRYALCINLLASIKCNCGMLSGCVYSALHLVMVYSVEYILCGICAFRTNRGDGVGWRLVQARHDWFHYAISPRSNARKTNTHTQELHTDLDAQFQVKENAECQPEQRIILRVNSVKTVDLLIYL